MVQQHLPTVCRLIAEATLQEDEPFAHGPAAYLHGPHVLWDLYCIGESSGVPLMTSARNVRTVTPSGARPHEALLIDDLKKPSELKRIVPLEGHTRVFRIAG